jgi:hypothetical protein
MLPAEGTPERDVAALDRYWVWPREKPGYTMFGAHIGRCSPTGGCCFYPRVRAASCISSSTALRRRPIISITQR